MAWVLDLDGVVRLGADPIPGAAEAVQLLLDAGEQVAFATNASAFPIAEQEAELEAMGIPAAGRVIGSAQAGASVLEPGSSVLLIGGEGLRQQVEQRGCRLVTEGPCDAVICGLDREFTYEKLHRASDAIRRGARWILTNIDATYPLPTGVEPGAGAIAAAISYAAGRDPEVAGKPAQPMADLVIQRLGSSGIVVGDRPDTDGRFARTLGYRFGLVYTGVTAPEERPVDPEPDVAAADLLSLVRAELARS